MEDKLNRKGDFNFDPEWDESFREFYEKWSPKVDKIVFRKIKSIDWEGVASRIWISFFPKYRPDLGHSVNWGYLWLRTYSRCNDYYRREGRKGNFCEFQNEDVIITTVYGMTREEIRVFIKECLNKEEARLLFEYFVGKRSLKDMSKEYGKSPNTIRSMIFKAKNKIRKSWDK